MLASHDRRKVIKISKISSVGTFTFVLYVEGVMYNILSISIKIIMAQKN